MKLKQQASGRLRKARGVALVFALLALVALTLGAVALVRSVDSGVMALGNLSFKMSGVASGARGAEVAQAWIETRIATSLESLNSNDTTNGYYSTEMANLDVTGRSVGATEVLALVDWDNNGCKVNGQDSGTVSCVDPSPSITVGGDEVNYIITRLCSQPWAVNEVHGTVANNCAMPKGISTTEGSGRGALSQSEYESLGTQAMSPYFRIITRTKGPKGTISYTETLVHF